MKTFQDPDTQDRLNVVLALQRGQRACHLAFETPKLSVQQMGFWGECQRPGVADEQFKDDGILKLPNDLRNSRLSDAESVGNGREASKITAHEKNAGLIAQDGVCNGFAHVYP